MASHSAAVLLIQYARTQSLCTFFACDVGSKSKLCSSNISSPLELLAVRRCLRFLRTTLKGVWITYDWGVGLLPMTFPGVFHPFCWSNFTGTESPGCRLERGRTPCLLVSKSWRYAVLDCSSFLASHTEIPLGGHVVYSPQCQSHVEKESILHGQGRLCRCSRQLKMKLWIL